MNKNKINIKNYPKAELHHHFDGAFKAKSLYETAKRNNLTQAKFSLSEFTQRTQVTKSCNSLTQFLNTFHFYYEIAQDVQFLKQAVYDLFKQLKDDNIIYCETRFAPHLLSYNDYSAEIITQTILKEVEALNTSQSDIKVNIILSVMRGSPIKLIQENIDFYRKFHNKGVVGIDLAGDESIHSGEEYIGIFQEACQENIPITIHAGEADNYKSIEMAVDSFGAQRIGHGVNIIESLALMQKVKELDICFEVCPTSNLHTGIIQNYAQHPFIEMFKNNLSLTINTDDPSVSNITLSHEYNIALEYFQLSHESLLEITQNAIKYSFQSENEKQKLLQKLKISNYS